MQQVLASGAHPTAVLASNDLTAIGAMGAIAEAGLRVPHDISVIGCDDIQLSAYTMPPLTTVSLPRAEIATAAFRALLSAGNPNATQPAAGATHTIHPTLVLRKSTGPVPTPRRAS